MVGEMVKLIDFYELDRLFVSLVQQQNCHQCSREITIPETPAVGQLLREEQAMCRQVPGRRWKGLPSRTLRVVDMRLLQEEWRG